MSLYKRISKRIKMTYGSFKSDCNFSLYYAVLRLTDELGGRIGFKKLSNKAHVKREQWIFKYLNDSLNPIIQTYAKDNYNGEYSEHSPIWICWWTGEDTAPELVKQCIKSIRANAGKREVVFIDKNNYTNYIDIPVYISEKVKSGNMKIAHLCDYIRVSLLSKFGGLWLDSTIFCKDIIPDDYFSLPFFTCSSSYTPECSYVSKLRWVTFVMGGWKNNILFRYLQSAFEEYWDNNKTDIDYLFFDYLIELGYNNIPAIKQLIDNVPINNIHRDDLQAAMNEALPAENFERIIKANDDTVLYKLSWRETYSLTTKDGEESIYSYFLNNKFKE